MDRHLQMFLVPIGSKWISIAMLVYLLAPEMSVDSFWDIVFPVLIFPQNSQHTNLEQNQKVSTGLPPWN